MVYALVVGSAAFVLSLVAGGPVVALLRRSGLGKAIRGFKDSVSGKDAIDVTPKKDTDTKSGKG